MRQIAGIIAADAGVTLNSGPRPRYAPAPQPRPLSLGELLVLGVVLLLVIFVLARFGGSGLLGFLIGMFLGGGGGGGGAVAVAAVVAAAEEAAAASEDLAGEVPAAAALPAVGRLTKLRAREGEL